MAAPFEAQGGLRPLRPQEYFIPGSVLEVLLYAIARHMIVGHEDAVQNLVSVGAIALIFIIRKYFFVPSFGYKMPGGKIAPDMEQKAAETPEAKAGDMAE